MGSTNYVYFVGSAPTESKQPARRHHREQERPAERFQGVLRPGQGGQVERHVESNGILGRLWGKGIGEGDRHTVLDPTVK